MALNFSINKNLALPAAKTLAKGFGLPLVKRAFINKQEIDEGDKSDGTSLFNTPLYGTMFIHKPVYSEFEYDDINKKYVQSSVNLSDTKTIGGEQGVFIEGVIIDVSNPRNIVKTAIAGLDGTVKEFINNGDFHVSIKGYFASVNPDVFPDVETRALNTYCKAPVSLKVTNVFLNDYFGITDLVVENYMFKQEEGVRNIQFFEMQCVSDTPNEILEKKA